jgi:RNA polymerase sigma-32 factor
MALDGYNGGGLTRQAMKAELLDAETEASLARAWRDARDAAALHRLVQAYMRLAISVAARYRRYGMAMPDLIQEASLGLMKAADKFDPDRGVRFSTYAVWWIKASVQDAVMRNWSLVRTGSTSAQKALFFNLRRVQARLQREAAQRGEALDGHQLTERVALDMGLTMADVQMMDGRLSGGDFSLNVPQGSDEDGREWVEVLEDDAPATEAHVAAQQDLARLRSVLAGELARLNARERHILTERLLRDAPRTLESLGAELSLSKERVRQLEAAALKKLRRKLEAEGKVLQDWLA